MFKFLFNVLIFFFYTKATINERVLICGTCKDVSKQLPRTIKIIENIGQLFTDYRVLVYENNSIDNTKEILKQWVAKNPKVKLQCENLNENLLKENLINKDYIKSEGIARARNIILDKIFLPKYELFPYIIWIDMDFTIPPFYNGIKEVFESKKEWDAVFANGIDPDNNFWDWFALRDNIEPFGPELIGHYNWYKKKESRPLTKYDDWYPVYSAFGGCGIYKKKSIKGCRYSGIVTPDLEKVAKIIIETGMLNNHPIVLYYLNDLKNIKFRHYIEKDSHDLKKITDYKTTGITIQQHPEALIWRMNSFTYQYPATCEHVTFHASMIVKGHDKLFINPRMLFHYGDVIKS